jgi:hypothetical protein
MTGQPDELPLRYRPQRLLNFVTCHSADDGEKVSLGRGSDVRIPRFLAGKWSVKFHFLEAAVRR